MLAQTFASFYQLNKRVTSLMFLEAMEQKSVKHGGSLEHLT